jgi:hypothetical protein
MVLSVKVMAVVLALLSSSLRTAAARHRGMVQDFHVGE